MERTSDFERVTTGQSGRRLIKRGLQLVGSAVGRLLWCFPDESLVILMYHRILPHDHPHWQTMQPGMVVSEGSFDLHLRVLKEHFTLIHLSEWLKRAQEGKPLPPRACAITFDDGWSDTYEVAYPILRRHQVPATVFLVSDYVGTTRRFWPERLVEVLRRARTVPGAWSREEFAWLRFLNLRPMLTLDEIISCVKALPDRDIQNRLEVMEERLGLLSREGPPHVMTWTQARELVSSGLVEAGSHTRTHYRLGRAADDDLTAREIVGSKHILEEELGRQVDLFCYPNGEMGPHADKLVRRHYLAACSTERGWNNADHDRHRLRRIGMHDGVSADHHAFLARLTGWV